ncbi:unnamed protein product [Lymnaea stagnalis]|uniref:Small ribosomal subunit protein mS23 n=1 Tax=Lymnaea stagnalis TaxID=6523 RepID=A0AAV2H897_LYMST
MAGSRREKLGSIFARMSGLLRSGAIKEEDRPIWYDVIKAIPPKPVPPPKQVQNILYPEDFVIAHFYRTYTDPEPVRLNDHKNKTVLQRFVDKYFELQSKKSVPTDQLFNETLLTLKAEGIHLITHAEKQSRTKGKSPVSGGETFTDQMPITVSKKLDVNKIPQINLQQLFDKPG